MGIRRLTELMSADAPPNSQGKLKSLWDAVRQPDDIEPPSPDADEGLQPGDMDAGLPSAIAGDPGDGPVVGIKPTDISALPSTKRLQALEGQLNGVTQKPSLMDRVKAVAPTAIATGIGAIFGQGGAAGQGAANYQQEKVAAKVAQRKSLSDQIIAAQRAQAQEYNTSERTREAAEASGNAARARMEAARMGAGARTYSADVAGQTRLGVADKTVAGRQKVEETRGQTQRDVAGTRADASKAVAATGAAARIQAAREYAQAAAQRQANGFGQQDHMQDRRQQFSMDKPTAAEDNRADYLQGLKENLDTMEDIAKRRPELFGKVSGRVSAARSAIGTDDPDLAAFTQSQHNLGIIMTSTHGMRAASLIPGAIHSVTNGMKNSPGAFLTATQTLRKSGETMGGTYSRPTRRLTPQVPGASSSRSSSSPKKNDPAGLF